MVSYLNRPVISSWLLNHIILLLLLILVDNNDENIHNYLNSQISIMKLLQKKIWQKLHTFFVRSLWLLLRNL